jgi:hypothetical protein
VVGVECVCCFNNEKKTHPLHIAPVHQKVSIGAATIPTTRWAVSGELQGVMFLKSYFITFSSVVCKVRSLEASYSRPMSWPARSRIHNERDVAAASLRQA